MRSLVKKYLYYSVSMPFILGERTMVVL